MLAVAIFVPCFFIVTIGLALVSEVTVNFVHLSLVYGVEPVVQGPIYFASMKPGLIVSNGDHLTGISHGWHYVAIPALWFSLIFGLLFLIRKLTGGRFPKWSWDREEVQQHGDR